MIRDQQFQSEMDRQNEAFTATTKRLLDQEKQSRDYQLALTKGIDDNLNALKAATPTLHSAGCAMISKIGEWPLYGVRARVAETIAEHKPALPEWICYPRVEGIAMDMKSFGKGADATKAVAETAGKALDQTAGFMKALESPFRNLLGIYNDKVQYRRWTNRILLIEDARKFMTERGLLKLTMEIPLKFGVPLVESASLEEDEDLRKIWARLLVNAGDASKPMEPRPAYVRILSCMSSMDCAPALLCEASQAPEVSGSTEAERGCPVLSL